MKLLTFINHLLPMEIRPALTALVITTIDIETVLKIISLVLSISFLIWKWREDIKKSKNK